MADNAFAALLESADGFVVYRLRVDPEAIDGAVVEFVSPSLVDVMGVAPDTPFPAWFSAIHRDDRDRMAQANAAAAAAGAVFDQTFRTWHAPTRTWRWVHAKSHPVFGEQGQAIAFNGMLVDVTAQQTALHNEARQRDQAEASQHLETLGQLAGGIAHDVNNLLMVVAGNVAALRSAGDGMDAAQRGQYLDAIDGQVANAGDLTGLLLGVAGQGNYMPGTLDLTDLVRGLASGLARTRRDVTVSLDLPGPAWTHADPVQLQRALTNLVVNAFDAMPDGGLLRVSLHPGASGGDGPGEPTAGPHRLSVADSGPGMDADTLAHAFEPFWSTKPRGRGTGLGLSAARGIIEGAGGRLQADTREGAGTRMLVELPVSPAPVASAEQAPAAAIRSPAPAGPRGCVLVVDDEPMVAQALREMVRVLGYEALMALDGQQALALCHQQQVDLMLLDVVMPGRSGPQLARHLRAQLGRDIPFFLCSGYATDAEAQAALDDGALGFLNKPLRLDDLRQHLDGALAPG